MFLIALVLGAHCVLILCWALPDNAVTGAVDDRVLAAYVDNPIVPFEQSWSVFAPTPRRVADRLQIRAEYGTVAGPRSVRTAWFDVTADEDSRVRGQIDPSRFHSVANRLSSAMTAAIGGLVPQQRQIVARDLVLTPQDRIRTLLVDAASDPVSSRRSVARYERGEDVLRRFATMYASARWGPGVTAIEVRIGRRDVPQFDRRGSVDLGDVACQELRIGLRAAIEPDPAAQRWFDQYVRPAPAGERSAVRSAR